MTAIASSSYILKLTTAVQGEVDLRKERTLSSFQSFKSSRKPDLDLIADAFTFAQDSPLQYKVIDLISIYRNVLELRSDIHSSRVPTCDKFLDEVEKCLNYFLDHKILPERKMRVSQIIGPVAELADARIKKGM